MNGKKYLQDIKKELQAGHYQHRKGISILNAFGYSRRRQTVLNEINREMEILGIASFPEIDEFMPMDSSHISFFLKGDKPPVEIGADSIRVEDDNQEDEEILQDVGFPTFKVGELSAASTPVCCVKQSGDLKDAYTTMCMNKYSQLVVADSDRPLATAIKGIITYQSITDALLGGKEKTIRECQTETVPQVSVDSEIGEVVGFLEEHDVVLVIGPDKRLSGIITAWDLAVEFADLVGPFKWIGEIEARLRSRIRGKLRDIDYSKWFSGSTYPMQDDPDMFTIGDLFRIMQNPDCWEQLDLAFDREIFIGELDKVRNARNRLMHFRDPLQPEEKKQIRNFCDLVRRIPPVID